MMTIQRSGFSLIELMVTLAIVAILSAIALPAYSAYLRRAHRAEGRMALLQMMEQQERYFSQNNTYSAFGAGLGSAQPAEFRWWSGANAAASYYELSAQPCEGSDLRTCVKLIATPGTDRVKSGFRDGACGVLSMTSSGVREPELPQECWQ